MPQDTEILCESTILCPMLLSAQCTLADSQQEISLDWKTLCQLDSLGPWFPCTIRVAQQASKAGEKTSLESPNKKEGNFSAGFFFVFILTDVDRSQNLPTDNHCHLFLSERNFWRPDNFRKRVFQNNCGSNSWSHGIGGEMVAKATKLFSF